MYKVSAIVPAYNEEGRIGKVLKVLSESSLINEIIVIDDCSTDNTSAEAIMFPKVKLITSKVNLEKNGSVMLGTKQATGDIFLFFDADLINLDTQLIENLILPVVENKADMTLSHREGDPFFFKYIIPGTPFTSGERCFKKDYYWKIDGLNECKNYEFEILANKYFLKNKLKIAVVSADKLKNTMKYEKNGILSGSIKDLKMAISLILKFGLLEILRQIFLISYAYQIKRRLTSDKTIYIN